MKCQKKCKKEKMEQIQCSMSSKKHCMKKYIKFSGGFSVRNISRQSTWVRIYFIISGSTCFFQNSVTRRQTRQWELFKIYGTENVVGKCLMNEELDRWTTIEMSWWKDPELCFCFPFLLHRNIYFCFGLFL